VGVAQWYEALMAGAMLELIDPMVERERVEFYRHCLSRCKILVTATQAHKMVMRMGREYVSN
jgi:hypothetical protein